MSQIGKLIDKKLVTDFPRWLPSAIQYETIMGSQSYGVASDQSDIDVYGFCIPPKELVFPHLAGDIPGFGRQKQRFEQWQNHGIIDGDKKYDYSIYSIVQYFSLCMENNPNMIDSLFTTQADILTCTRIGQMVKERRKIFLHAGAWHKFKGYAYSQLHKIKQKELPKSEKRRESVEKYGYDVKFAYHTVRLILEVEMILAECDLDLRRHSDQLKAIRNGEWELAKVQEWFDNKEKDLESLYANTKLPYTPDETAIKSLLIECMEEYWGSLKGVVNTADQYMNAISKIQEIVGKF